MYGAMGTFWPRGAPAATSTSTNLSSSERSCSRKFSRIPGLYPACYLHSRSPDFARSKALTSGSRTLLPMPYSFLGSSCRRTPLSVPSLIPTPVIRKTIAQKLRAVNEPYLTQSITSEKNEGESEVLHEYPGADALQLDEEGSSVDAVQLNERGSSSEVGVLLSIDRLSFSVARIVSVLQFI